MEIPQWWLRLKNKGGEYDVLGRIKNIKEVFGIDNYYHSGMDGYKVETDKYVFHVLVSNGQHCCEEWGYLSSDDDFSLFIGSELLEVKLTDTALNQAVVDESGYYDDAGGIQFVDFVTSGGVFQLVVYNAHNGFYGHDVLVTKGKEVLMADKL